MGSQKAERHLSSNLPSEIWTHVWVKSSKGNSISCNDFSRDFHKLSNVCLTQSNFIRTYRDKKAERRN